jgi:transposase
MQADGNQINALPEDPALLQALLLAAWSERDKVVAERDNVVAERNALAEQNERLQHLLLKLKRLQFGAKSERLPEEQLQLALGDIETAIAQLEAQGEQRDHTRKRDGIAKRRASRGALPAHLPRVEVTLTPEDTNCPCCRVAMREIGHDESQRLDVIPAQYRVIVTRRPKFVCQACEGVVTQAPAPARLIEGGIPTEALVANVMVSRFADHLPLYRQAQIMARQGVLIDRATLAFWVGYGAAEIMPVVRRLKEIVLSSTRIFADETTMRVLDHGRGRTKQGYFWVAARDDRACGGAGPPAVIYQYATGRAKRHADALLGGYHGIVQCDGYNAYKQLAGTARDGAPVTLAFCWSHVRRGFYDFAKDGTSPIATEALARIAALYRIEAEIRGRNPAQRLGTRQELSRPLVKDLRLWFEAQLKTLPARGPIAEVIRYPLNHWAGLEQFLDDGRIEIDNNTVERSMRPITLSRKNSLFAGSDEGAENWAAVASLIETCKVNSVNPQTYFTDLLTRLVNGWPQARIDELMPWCWKTPAAV